MKTNRHCAPRGFTLIELLVVIGIILVLMALLLPMVNRSRRQAQANSIQADLITISQALDQYRDQFGMYPQTGLGTPVGGSTATKRVSGAVALCWALVAPGPARQDGAGLMNGTQVANPDTGAFGFRTSVVGQGTIKGPYLNMDHFRIGTVPASGTRNNQVLPVNPTSSTPFDDTQDVLADGLGNIILYWPSYPQFKGTPNLAAQWTIGTTPKALFNYSDNNVQIVNNAMLRTVPNFLTFRVFAFRLGSSKLNGTLVPGDVPTAAPYLLWSAGPDGLFGPRVKGNGTATADDDDVTNVPLNPFPTTLVP